MVKYCLQDYDQIKVFALQETLISLWLHPVKGAASRIVCQN